MPRHWQPKSPKDCPFCPDQPQPPQSSEPVPALTPYPQRKSPRGRKKQLHTEGYACPAETCDFYGITDSSVHALVGHGKIGQDKSIQRLRCVLFSAIDRRACSFHIVPGGSMLLAKTMARQMDGVPMTHLGKVYKNLMVDVLITNEKLYRRACDIIGYLTAMNNTAAQMLLKRANNHVKTALVMHFRGVEYEIARLLLQEHNGVLTSIIE